MSSASTAALTLGPLRCSSFGDFGLKPEIQRAIANLGFKNPTPTEVQNQCTPQAVLGKDILCQADPDMGKTVTFVLATLQQLQATRNVNVLVLCHNRGLALLVGKEYERFATYMSRVKVGVFVGRNAIEEDEETLRNVTPHIVVGTPGRILALIRGKNLDLNYVKHFVINECETVLEQKSMNRDVSEIFYNTPREKQVMMFSSTLREEIRPICRRFLKNPMEVYFPTDADKQLTLHGMQQQFGKLDLKKICSKRSKTDSESGLNSKKYKCQADTLRYQKMMIPVEKVGLIIGADGATIKKLQQETGAKMSIIPDNPNQEKTVSEHKALRISGGPQVIEHAKKLVLQLIASKDTDVQAEQQYEVPIPDVAVGAIIRRRHRMIRRIQTESGCRLQLIQGENDKSGDKRCLIRGSRLQVDVAKRKIDRLIENVMRQYRGSNRPSGGSVKVNGSSK